MLWAALYFPDMMLARSSPTKALPKALPKEPPKELVTEPEEFEPPRAIIAVSYTHLTLPTICSV